MDPPKENFNPILLPELLIENLDPSRSLEEATKERDALHIRILEADVATKEHEEALQGILGSVQAVRGILEKILDRVCDDKVDKFDECLNSDSKDGLEILAFEARNICELGKEVESKFSEYMEMRRKEKIGLESSVLSLMEENKDIGSMLRIAITEKEAAEKSLGRSKGGEEQRKGAILQIAEKGLQKVGFGFVMAVISGEMQSEQLRSSSASIKSDRSECEEEVVSLASTVEKIMKNLRLEISDIRQALDESRLNCEHLQLLVDEQAQKKIEHELHIKDLEERENLLVHSVEELTTEIREVEQEVARWREACELEVEAGKAAIRELNKEVNLLREELERTRADLDAANSKLQLKEKLAATAMAAQAAADACLQLADSRSAGLQQRIEELTRQLEEEDDHGRKERKGARKRIRHVCWPWQQFRVISVASHATTQCVDQNGRLLPEM